MCVCRVVNDCMYKRSNLDQEQKRIATECFHVIKSWNSSKDDVDSAFELLAKQSPALERTVNFLKQWVLPEMLVRDFWFVAH